MNPVARTHTAITSFSVALVTRHRPSFEAGVALAARARGRLVPRWRSSRVHRDPRRRSTRFHGRDRSLTIQQPLLSSRGRPARSLRGVGACRRWRLGRDRFVLHSCSRHRWQLPHSPARRRSSALSWWTTRSYSRDLPSRLCSLDSFRRTRAVIACSRRRSRPTRVQSRGYPEQRRARTASRKYRIPTPLARRCSCWPPLRLSVDEAPFARLLGARTPDVGRSACPPRLTARRAHTRKRA